MKYPPDHAPTPDSASFDETLRLIAHAPVPEGLEERVHTAVFHAAPRRGRLLAWPVSAQSPAFWAANNWMRATAAAAIVFVVGGGGWGVYRHVERPVAKVIVMPVAQPALSGGFSSAGAIRTPQTVKGPTVKNLVAQPVGSVQKRAKKKQAVTPAAPVPGVVGQPSPAPAAAGR